MAEALVVGLVAGLLGAVMGAAAACWLLRARMDALAAALRAPRSDPRPLVSLQNEVRQLAQRLAMQDDVQVERLHQWQREVVRFVGESQKRQAPEWRAPSKQGADVPTAGAMPKRPHEPMFAPVPRPPAAASVAAPPARELTDEEIDALPPELPAPTRRKRLAQAPAKPTMRGI